MNKQEFVPISIVLALALAVVYSLWSLTAPFIDRLSGKTTMQGRLQKFEKAFTGPESLFADCHGSAGALMFIPDGQNFGYLLESEQKGPEGYVGRTVMVTGQIQEWTKEVPARFQESAIDQNGRTVWSERPGTSTIPCYKILDAEITRQF